MSTIMLSVFILLTAIASNVLEAKAINETSTDDSEYPCMTRESGACNDSDVCCRPGDAITLTATGPDFVVKNTHLTQRNVDNDTVATKGESDAAGSAAQPTDAPDVKYTCSCQSAEAAAKEAEKIESGVMASINAMNQRIKDVFGSIADGMPDWMSF